MAGGRGAGRRREGSPAIDQCSALLCFRLLLSEVSIIVCTMSLVGSDCSFNFRFFEGVLYV